MKGARSALAFGLLVLFHEFVGGVVYGYEPPLNAVIPPPPLCVNWMGFLIIASKSLETKGDIAFPVAKLVSRSSPPARLPVDIPIPATMPRKDRGATRRRPEFQPIRRACAVDSTRIGMDRERNRQQKLGCTERLIEWCLPASLPCVPLDATSEPNGRLWFVPSDPPILSHLCN